MSPPSLRQWMHEAPRRPSSPGSLHERMAAMENALFELREAILSRGAPSEPTPIDARAVSAEDGGHGRGGGGRGLRAEEQQLAAASGANRTSWLQRGLSNKKNRVPSSRLKGSGRIAGVGTPRLGLARSCPPPPATALSTSTAAASHEDDVAMEKEQGSSWDELGSLDLFGDLYEGGHAGHHRNDGHAHEKVPHGVLLPWSRSLLGWDLICSTMLLIMCFYLPLRLSFLSDQILSWPGDAWLLAIDAAYLLDMLVGMTTAYYDYLGNLETRRWQVLKHYLTGWFALDLITCFPSDWLYLGLTAASNTQPNPTALLFLRALRLGRTLRLLTHRRVFTYLSHVFSRLKIRAAYVTIARRTIVTIIFAHCNACLQFLISVLEGLPDDCWVVRAEIDHASTTTQYLASIFHAVSQMLAVGHGVVLPKRDSEYLMFVVSLVLGANLYAVFVGTLISVIEDANGSHREYASESTCDGAKTAPQALTVQTGDLSRDPIPRGPRFR